MCMSKKKPSSDSFLRKVVKRGDSPPVITVPKENEDTFPAGTWVKVIRLED